MRWLALAVLLAVLILHPYVDAGSDSDDALEIGCKALCHLFNPYLCRTQLGNPLTPLPGWLILNLPCALIGAHAWCLVWIAIWARGKPAWAVVVLLVLASKTLVQGIEYAANGCAVVWACSLLASDVSPRNASPAALEPPGGVSTSGSGFDRGRGPFLWMGRAYGEPGVCSRDGGDYAMRCMWAGVLLCLPALWVTNSAYHMLMAVPFLLEGCKRRR